MRALILLVSTLAFGIVGCKEDDAAPQVPLQQVRAIRAQVGQYQSTADITGEVRARVQSDQSFRVAGKVTERLVDVGAHVAKGDILARLDDSEQRTDLTSARASVDAAQATLRQKTLAFDRYKTLAATGATAQSTFDQARADLATAQGTLDAAEVSLALSQDALSYTVLRANADGLITARDIEVGQVVSAAQAAFTLANDGPRDAVFDVYEAFLLEGAPSPEVTVASVTDRADSSAGRIREISPTIDAEAGTIRVKVALNADLKQALGNPVMGEFRSRVHQGIILPWGAMSSQSGHPSVWTIDPGDKAVSQHAVKIDRYRNGDFIVSDGIEAGALVVVEGAQFLSDGQTVDWQER
ncbi:MAG TPA: efflux RND transporter periplasmic adaptor subunit [Paenirhodobacter sp.]